MKFIIIFLLLGSSLIARSQSQEKPILQPELLNMGIKRVDSLVAKEITKENVGCINIGIVFNGNLFWTKSYGYADIEKKIPATQDLVFPIGSITKQFTALMLEQLVEKGIVRLSDPVEKYLPEVKNLQNPFLGAPAITLLQLATHTSGLDREPDDEKMLYIKGPVNEWEEKLIATIPLTRFIYEPGTRHSYSNIGYAILGAALARAAGEPYINYIENRILKPLGMSHTTFSLDKRMEKNRPKGFLIENGKIDTEEPERQENEGRGWRVPPGRLYSTIEDLSRFLAFQLGKEDSTVLNKKTMDAHLRRIYAASADLTYAYGIGLQVRRRGSVIALGHDGVLAGYQCSVWIDPKTSLGIITLTTIQEKFLGLRAFELLITTVTPAL